tara:strand:- start:104 stop:253 length:150 start_codon:yes stop_codon:yes gene_type:complete
MDKEELLKVFIEARDMLCDLEEEYNQPIHKDAPILRLIAKMNKIILEEE